jgi:hypothetical protein
MLKSKKRSILNARKKSDFVAQHWYNSLKPGKVDFVEYMGELSELERQVQMFARSTFEVKFTPRFKKTMERLFDPLKLFLKEYQDSSKLENSEDEWMVLEDNQAFSENDVPCMDQTKVDFMKVETLTRGSISANIVLEMYPWLPTDVLKLITYYSDEDYEPQKQQVFRSPNCGVRYDEKAISDVKKSIGIRPRASLLFNEKKFFDFLKRNFDRRFGSINITSTVVDLKKLDSNEKLALDLLTEVWSYPFKQHLFHEKFLPHMGGPFKKLEDNESRQWFERSNGSQRLKLLPHVYQLDQAYKMSQFETISLKNGFSNFRVDAKIFKFRFTGFSKRFANPSDSDSVSKTFQGSAKVLFNPISLVTIPNLDNESEEKFKTLSPEFSCQGAILANEDGVGNTGMLILMALNTREVDAHVCEQVSFHPLKVLEGRIITSATLIACPDSLLHQIHSEIVSTTNFASNQILSISTKAQHKKITAFDISQAQIVLISFNFLGGDYYNELMKYCPYREYRNVDNEYFMKSAPSFDSFHWHRIVVYEAHELFDDSTQKAFVPIAAARLIHYRASFKWAISPTPFSKISCQFSNYCSFLNLRVDDIPIALITAGSNEIPRLIKLSSQGSDHNNWIDVIGYIFQNFVMLRITKASIGVKDYSNQQEEVIFHVEMSEQEKIMHECVLDLGDKLSICATPLLFSDISAPFGVHIDEVYEELLQRFRSVLRDPGCLVVIGTQKPAHVFSHSTSVEGITVKGLSRDASESVQRSKFMEVNRPLGRNTFDVPSELQHRDSTHFWEMLTTYWGSKFSLACKLVRSLVQDASSRVVIFSVHSSVVESFVLLLEKLEVSVGISTREVPSQAKLFRTLEERKRSKKKTTPKGVQVIIMSWNARVFEADCKMCTHIVVLDSPVGSRQQVQSIEIRAMEKILKHRKDKPTTIFRLLCEDSVEMDLFKSRNISV